MMRWLAVLGLSIFLSGCATHQASIVQVPIQAVTVIEETWTNEKTPLEHKIIGILKEEKIEEDLWERIRLGFDMEDPDRAITDRHVSQLKANPVYVNRVLERSSAYLFYIIEEVEARGMPSELALLPFVESAFNPKAVSPVKAAGMWQFMPATGKYFKLDQNIFRDERGDIVKSTQAALDYLQKLYDMFGDWSLALAAYNWGEGSVGRAIEKKRVAKLPTDYWHLTMPNETKNYVPKLLAYKRIIAEPEKYGFTLPRVKNHPYFVSIPVEHDIDVDKVIAYSEISREQFIALNPSFSGPVILQGFNQEILLPYGKAEIFKKNLLSDPAPLTQWTVIKVEKTDTVDNLATSLNVDIDQLREVNKIPKGMKVRAGSTLLIPKNDVVTENVPLNLAQNPFLSLEREYAPVPVVMRCQGKKCIAVPRNLANYQPRDNSKSKVAHASNPARVKSVNVVKPKTTSTSPKFAAKGVSSSSSSKVSIKTIAPIKP